MKKNNGQVFAPMNIIIIIFILAGVTISMNANNGILTRAEDALEKAKEAQRNEEMLLDEAQEQYQNYLNNYMQDNY